MRLFECSETRITDAGAFHRDIHNRISMGTIATKGLFEIICHIYIISVH